MKKNHEKNQLAAKASGPATRRRWLFAFVLCIFVLVGVDLALRIPGLGSAVYAPRHFEPAGGVPYTQTPKSDQVIYQPNTVFASVYDTAGDKRGYFGVDGKVVYRLNMFGMRGPDLPAGKPANGFRIICLGDSITFGEGVREEDTYPLQLQKLLSAAMSDKHVEVINEGVQGYGTKEEINHFGLVGRAFAPDLVIIGFFLNDAMDFGETIRQNDAKNKELALSPLARISKIWETLERRHHARATQDEYFMAIRQSFQSKNWESCKDALLGFRGESIRSRFRLIIAVFPVLWDLDAYPLTDVHSKVGESLRQLGIEYVDLLDAFRGHSAESLWVHPTDQHPNELAHRFAAERIAQFIQQSAK